MNRKWISVVMAVSALALAGIGDSRAQDDGNVAFGQYYETRLSYESDFYTYICRCQFDNAQILPGDGYDSEQECLDSQLGDLNRMDEIASCAQQISIDAANPPGWAKDVMDCRIANHESALQCIRKLDLEDDCSETALAQVRHCHIKTFGEGDGDDCDAYMEPGGTDEGWLTLVEFEIRNQCIEG